MQSLKTKKSASTDVYVAVNGVRIHAREQATGGLALVFLHYWGGSLRTWTSVVDELSREYRTVAMDHRGWGDSEAPPTGYGISDLADDAQGVVDALGLRRYVLVGHSMGGKVAQLIASRHPSGLKGLVLVAPSPPSPMKVSAEDRGRMAHAYDSRESIEFVLDNALTANPLTPEQREQVIADSLRGALQAKAAWPNAGMLEEIINEVVSINVPVVVIAGERDTVERAATLKEELLPRIPQVTMHVLPGTGHLSLLEAPDTPVDFIRNFLHTVVRKAADVNEI
jgi:pimeloyl-ACP methyl ester carboxylesterase